LFSHLWDAKISYPCQLFLAQIIMVVFVVENKIKTNPKKGLKFRINIQVYI
jgi:hypothetical protein